MKGLGAFSRAASWPLTGEAKLSGGKLSVALEIAVSGQGARYGVRAPQPILTAARARATLPMAEVIETDRPGKCHALNLGYQAAGPDVPVVCMDADMTHPPEAIPSMVEAADAGYAAGLIGAATRTQIYNAQNSCTEPPSGTVLGGMVEIHGKGGSTDWTAGWERHDELGIESRISAGAALGRYVVQTNRNQLSLTGGLNIPGMNLPF